MYSSIYQMLPVFCCCWQYGFGRRIKSVRCKWECCWWERSKVPWCLKSPATRLRFRAMTSSSPQASSFTSDWPSVHISPTAKLDTIFIKVCLGNAYFVCAFTGQTIFKMLDEIKRDFTAVRALILSMGAWDNWLFLEKWDENEIRHSKQCPSSCDSLVLKLIAFGVGSLAHVARHFWGGAFIRDFTELKQ